MNSKRPTMKDIAERAGIHQTTVSLALRNYPKIAKKTREKVQRIAREIGYSPDPMLSSLIAYRNNNDVKSYAPTIAYIMNVDGPEGLEETPVRKLFYDGAVERAKQLGYKMEVFYYGGRFYRSKRLDKVLRTRNITGIIIGGFLTSYTEIDLSWDNYSVVKIEALPRHVKAHTIENNQYQATRLGFQQSRNIGFKRIGLCVAEHDEKHTDNLFSAGYFVEEHAIDQSNRVPILVFPGNEFVTDLGDSVQLIADWMVDNNIDVCLSNWENLRKPIEMASQRLGRKVYQTSLDMDHFNEKSWGVRQNHETVGASAVDVVTGMMQSNQTGLMENPRINLVNGTWKAPPLDVVEQIKADVHVVHST